MYIKKNARVTFRSNKRSNFKRNNNYSNNKNRNKGNLTQQYNKFLKLAKEASASGDKIQAEYYYQFTDHYYRLMQEMGISIEDNINNENKVLTNSSEEISSDNDITSDEKKESNDTEISENFQNDEKDIESIESIPFIAKPAKKKVTKSKKASA
tara:strand:- start:1394 stop:1855 length:462 start_codon:yes stop_codon:yes gene_type:complete